VTEGRQRVEQALEVFRRTGNQQAAAGALNTLAMILSDLGDLTGARRHYEEALAIYRQTGNTADVGIVLNNIAEVLSAQADLAGARKSYEEALAAFRRAGNKSHSAYALFNLGMVQAAQDDLPGARARYTEALALRTGLGESLRIQESQLMLARLDIDEHQGECKVTCAIYATADKIGDVSDWSVGSNE